MFICLAGWGGTISHEVELLRVETLEMLRWRTSAQALCLGYRIWVLNLGTLKPSKTQGASLKPLLAGSLT